MVFQRKNPFSMQTEQPVLSKWYDHCFLVLWKCNATKCEYCVYKISQNDFLNYFISSHKWYQVTTLASSGEWLLSPTSSICHGTVLFWKCDKYVWILYCLPLSLMQIKSCWPQNVIHLDIALVLILRFYQL